MPAYNFVGMPPAFRQHVISHFLGLPYYLGSESCDDDIAFSLGTCFTHTSVGDKNARLLRPTTPIIAMLLSPHAWMDPLAGTIRRRFFQNTNCPDELVALFKRANILKGYDLFRFVTWPFAQPIQPEIIKMIDPNWKGWPPAITPKMVGEALEFELPPRRKPEEEYSWHKKGHCRRSRHAEYFVRLFCVMAACQAILNGEWQVRPPLALDLVINGKVRRVYWVQHPIDAMILQMTGIVLQYAFPPSDCSHGSVLRRGVHTAVERMKRLIAYEGHRIVVEFDVLRAFPSISRPRALQNINAALREHDDFVHSGSSEIRKIKFSLWQSMSHVGRCINVNQAKDKDGNFVDVSSEGLLQGMPTASPLFNLALGPVDRVMERIHHDGGAAVTRYVDNFVISAKNMKDAIEAADILQRQLNGLGLQIVQKSEYVDLLGSTEPFKALGLEMRLSEGKFKVQAGLKSAHRLVDFIRNAPSAKAIAQAVKTFIFHYGRHGWMSVAACHRLASMMGQALAENPALRKAKNARNAVSHCAIEYLVRRIAKQSRHKVN